MLQSVPAQHTFMKPAKDTLRSKRLYRGAPGICAMRWYWQLQESDMFSMCSLSYHENKMHLDLEKAAPRPSRRPAPKGLWGRSGAWRCPEDL